MILLGSLISAGHQKVISANKTLINLESLNDEFKNNENIMLHKNDTLPMGDYFVVFTGDSLSVDGVNAYYTVEYYTKSNTGNLKKAFVLHPRVQLNERMGNVAEPSTLHKWNKDIFTHIAYADLEKIERLKKGQKEVEFDTDQFKEAQLFEVSEGDTIAATNCLVVFQKLTLVSDLDLEDENSLSVDLMGTFTIVQLNKDSYDLQPGFAIVENRMESYPAFDEKTGLKIAIQEIVPEKRKVRIAISEKMNNKSNEFIIMKAIIFPGMNILWLGCFLMVIGIFMSVLKRVLS
jgi:cytochrome c-type biogenesis protein CcmF